MRCNAPEFLGNLFEAIYQEDPMYFDIEMTWVGIFTYYRKKLLEDLMRTRPLDEYLLSQADAYVAHQYQGLWLV